MIAADTSSLVAYFGGERGRDVDRLVAALSAGELVLPPVVLTELLTDGSIDLAVETQLRDLGLLEIHDGFWSRAGLARRQLRDVHLNARVGDALIAQACIDNDVVLITRDADFRHFAKHCGLKLA